MVVFKNRITYLYVMDVLSLLHTGKQVKAILSKGFLQLNKALELQCSAKGWSVSPACRRGACVH